MRLLDFVKGCERVRLLHVSTCYVAGNRKRRNRRTSGNPHVSVGSSCNTSEWKEARELFDTLAADFDTPENLLRCRRKFKIGLSDNLDTTNEALIRNLTTKVYKRREGAVLGKRE